MTNIELNEDQQRRADMLIQSVNMDRELAREVIYLQDRDREFIEDRLWEMRIVCD